MSSLLYRIAENTGVNTVPEKQLFQLLSTDGKGGGTTNFKVNGASSSVPFYIQPGIDESFLLKRITLICVATSFTDATKYAGQTTTNGLSIRYERNGEIITDFTSGRAIIGTFDWALLAGIDAQSQDAQLSDPFTIRWTFGKSGSDILLRGSELERFVVDVRDDLSGSSFLYQYAMMQGVKING